MDQIRTNDLQIAFRRATVHGATNVYKLPDIGGKDPLLELWCHVEIEGGLTSLESYERHIS